MDPTTTNNESEPVWPQGWSIERYNRFSHNEMAASMSQEEMEHLIQIASAYPGITLNKEDGEPAWPAGWSLQRYSNMNVMEVFEIPYGDLALMTAIRDTFYPEPPLPSMEEILRNLAEQQARQRAELGLPPLSAAEIAASKEMTGQIVETVERLGPAPRAWGFVLLRATYGDDVRWEAFKSRFWELLRESVDPELEVGWERIRDNLRVEMVEDVVLDNAGLAERNKYVQDAREGINVAPGLDLPMFLVVDEDCIRSVLDEDGNGVPFVLAQDIEYGQLEEEDEEQDGESYPGFFKVSIDALLSSLYVGLQGMGMAPEELWPFADPVFEGTDFF